MVLFMANSVLSTHKIGKVETMFDSFRIKKIAVSIQFILIQFSSAFGIIFRSHPHACWRHLSSSASLERTICMISF